MNDALYGLIVETVDQGPILWEAEDMSYDAVAKRMQDMRRRPGVIRVCMVSLHYEAGNQTLCPPAPAAEGSPF